MFQFMLVDVINVFIRILNLLIVAKQYFPVLEHKETSVQGRELNQRNPAYTISAGLSYTIHLVTLLAHFLDVNLPRKLCFR